MNPAALTSTAGISKGHRDAQAQVGHVYSKHTWQPTRSSHRSHTLRKFSLDTHTNQPAPAVASQVRRGDIFEGGQQPSSCPYLLGGGSIKEKGYQV